MHASPAGRISHSHMFHLLYYQMCCGKLLILLTEFIF